MRRWTDDILSGWGRSQQAHGISARPRLTGDLAGLVKDREHVIAHGLGRSYGDAATNTGQGAILTSALNRVLEFKRDSGLIVAEAGMSLDELLRLVLPLGWFVPVTPGTRFVSLGGCLAADVHGKNHHVAGTFSRHVPWFELLTANGDTLRCSADENAEVFRATAGGMGLTGIVTKIALHLQPVETGYLRVRHLRTGSLAETMEQLVRADRRWESTVAWLDGLADGSNLGRGELILGRYATGDELPGKLADEPFPELSGPRLAVPGTLPVSAVNRASVKAFNEFRYRRIDEGERFETVLQFFYPLDLAQDWNRLYGPKGFHQYQVVIPEQRAGHVLEAMLRAMQRPGLTPSLLVLKRFGEGSDNHLSFPALGWTLAVDIPSSPRLLETLDELDRLVADEGGRVYLAKDSRLSPEMFRRMYAQYESWLEVKRELDPKWRFSSDLSRRLRIDDDVLGGAA